VAVLHAWRKTSEAHVVAPIQLLAHGDGSVHAGAIAHALSKDTLRARPVHPDTPPAALGSTPLHPDGHAGLAVIEPVPGRDPTDRDEMPTQFEGYLSLVRLDAGDVEVERARRGAPGRRHGDRAVGRTNGTFAVICVLMSTVKLADAPLKVTAVAPVNPVPVMVTEVPTGPLNGRKARIVGGDGVTLKSSRLAVDPHGITWAFPDGISRSTRRPVRCATDPASGSAGPPAVTRVLALDWSCPPSSTVEPHSFERSGRDRPATKDVPAPPSPLDPPLPLLVRQPEEAWLSGYRRRAVTTD
jgi:hypothetical protein